MTESNSRTSSILMDEMTWPEVRQCAEAGLPVVLPVGATEQHGPHLPISVDTVLPVGVATEAAKHVPLVIAPPIRFGAKSRPLSGGGEGFPGTISVRASTLLLVIEDVLEALVRSGFRKIVLQCWHWENSFYLWEAAEQLLRRMPDLEAKFVVLHSPMPALTNEELDDLYPTGFPGWDVEHAAIFETGMMMDIAPHLVRQDLAVDDEVGRRANWEVVPPPPEFLTESGVLWRATEATAESGRRFTEVAASQIVDAIRTEFGDTDA